MIESISIHQIRVVDLSSMLSVRIPAKGVKHFWYGIIYREHRPSKLQIEFFFFCEKGAKFDINGANSLAKSRNQLLESQGSSTPSSCDPKRKGNSRKASRVTGEELPVMVFVKSHPVQTYLLDPEMPESGIHSSIHRLTSSINITSHEQHANEYTSTRAHEAHEHTKHKSTRSTWAQEHTKSRESHLLFD